MPAMAEPQGRGALPRARCDQPGAGFLAPFPFSPCALFAALPLPLLLAARFLFSSLLQSFIFLSLTICHLATGNRLYFPITNKFLSTFLPLQKGSCNTSPDEREAFARPIPVTHVLKLRQTWGPSHPPHPLPAPRMDIVLETVPGLASENLNPTGDPW